MNGIDLSWAGIKSLIRVKKTGTRGDKPYHEVVCYINSLIHPAREFACGIRGHWSIENRLHWIKDVVLKFGVKGDKLFVGLVREKFCDL
ncbi:hypothetical protein [Nostoc sp.]|uniref:hypothetical protein n=1 Tax=Nostoc sp. TaxID=1180 RepID=UPI002FF536B0